MNPWSEAGKVLHAGDVILQLGGLQVGNDGKVAFR